MKQYIPLLPSLSPLLFLHTKKVQNNSDYPLSQVAQAYYFERNAIWQGLEDVGLQKNDEVLFPAYNSGTEEDVLESAGIRLNFYDINRDLRISIEHLEKRVTQDTKALYIIHYFGFAQPMEEILQFCKKRNLMLLEDCAISLFSKNSGQFLGMYGDVSFFCLRKFLPIPNGGVLVRNFKFKQDNTSGAHNSNVFQWVRPSRVSTLVELSSLLFAGMVKQFPVLLAIMYSIKKCVRRFLGSKKVDSGAPRFNMQTRHWGMAPISRFILDKLDYTRIVTQRCKNYWYLKEQLKPLVESYKQLSFLDAQEQEGFVPFCFPLVVDDNQRMEQELRKRGIECGAWWYTDYRKDKKQHCPVNAWLRTHVIELPIHQGINEQDIDYMVYSLKEIIS